MKRVVLPELLDALDPRDPRARFNPAATFSELIF